MSQTRDEKGCEIFDEVTCQEKKCDGLWLDTGCQRKATCKSLETECPAQSHDETGCLLAALTPNPNCSGTTEIKCTSGKQRACIASLTWKRD